MMRYRYYLISLLLHTLILSVFIILSDSASHNKKFGNTQANAISAFIYQGNFEKSVSMQQQAKLKSHPEKKRALQALKIPARKETHEHNVTQVVSAHASVSQGEFTTTLIALLHDAIQRKQHYPASAWEMQREGRVTVAFQLYADGHITDLRILTSSGTSSLDQAAVQAVNDAAPFHEVVAYIKQPHEYQIDIVFELA